MTRVLMVSDVHMSNNLPYSKYSDGMVTDRMIDQRALWARIHHTAKAHDVDAILVLGDLFDTSKVDPVTMYETVGCLVQTPRPLHILPGNHDAAATHGGRFASEAFGAMDHPMIHELGEEPLVIGAVRFWPVPFCLSGPAYERLKEIRERIAEGREPWEVVLMHHSIIGCTHVGWTCDTGLDPLIVCDGFDRVYTGHFHDAQKFGPDGRGRYLGAPMHLRFDDDGREAGFWIVEFGHDEVRETFIDGGAPRFHRASFEQDQHGKAVIRYNEKPKPGDYVRISVEATHARYHAIKDAVQEYVDGLIAEGIHANYFHKPIYQHDRRLKRKHLAGGLETAILGYVDAPDVDTAGLDTAKLKEYGRWALGEARKAK